MPHTVLLHIGPIKTATTTLQRNVFLQLHEEKKINYIGLWFTSWKRPNPPFPLGTLQSTKAKVFTESEIQQRRTNLESSLQQNQLNIISCELFSRTFHIKRNAHTTFFNLSRLLSNCTVIVLASLRNPADLFFSSYVQNYSEKYRWMPKYNTFNKFYRAILSNGHNSRYNIYFPERYLNLIDQYFDNKKILFFEDLKCDPEHYFSVLSKLLNIAPHEVKEKFLSKHRNRKKTTSNGKSTDSSTPITLIEFFLIRHLKNRIPTTLRNQFRFFYISLKKILRYLPKSKHEFTYLEEKEHEKLRDLLSIKSLDEFSARHQISKEKLISYGYTSHSH